MKQAARAFRDPFSMLRTGIEQWCWHRLRSAHHPRGLSADCDQAASPNLSAQRSWKSEASDIRPTPAELYDLICGPRVPLESNHSLLASIQEPSSNALGIADAATIRQIVEMSQRLFPGPVEFEYAFDPEDPSDEYVIFDVIAHGEYKDYRDRELQWHDEVRKIVPGSLGEFSLSVTPQR